jgi:hypothetical protein
MLIKRILSLCTAVLFGFAVFPSYGGDIISCNGFESCPEADTSALEARIAALEALLAGATRRVDPGNSQDTLTLGNSITSEGVKIPELSTTGREGASLVCFNSAGELLPCADGVEPPPPSHPYGGTWTGRMIYDRRSTGTCHDADAYMTINPGETFSRISSFTVIRDSGGLDTWSGARYLYHDTGTASGGIQLFSSDIATVITISLQFNTQGSAQGYWNYDNGNCYGEWSFTKG